MKMILFFLILSACKFNTSPYSADVPKLLLNSHQINEVKRTEASDSDTFKVALISDTHNYYSDLNDLIKAIGRNGPYRFVIINGDVSNGGLKSEFEESRRLFQKLHAPFITGIGNHDLLANGPKIFSRMFGSTDFSFEYKNVLFVFFNSNNWETAGKVPDLPKIKEMISASSSPFKVLITHVPFYDEDRFSESEQDEFEKLVLTESIDYVFHGHNHNPGEAFFVGAAQITIGAPSKRIYYELIVTPGGLSHKKIHF